MHLTQCITAKLYLSGLLKHPLRAGYAYAWIALKEKLFAQETVASLYTKIKEYQDDDSKQSLE
ncbi:MAG: hypothetical protein V7K24_06305 [Nostoc sp.]